MQYMEGSENWGCVTTSVECERGAPMPLNATAAVQPEALQQQPYLAVLGYALLQRGQRLNEQKRIKFGVLVIVLVPLLLVVQLALRCFGHLGRRRVVVVCVRVVLLVRRGGSVVVVVVARGSFRLAAGCAWLRVVPPRVPLKLPPL